MRQPVPVRKIRSLQQMVLEKHIQSNETGNFTLLPKNNSKWIKDLNVRPETIELPEGNIGKKLIGILALEMIFLYMMLKAQKKKMNIWDYIKLKSFCTAQETN